MSIDKKFEIRIKKRNIKETTLRDKDTTCGKYLNELRHPREDFSDNKSL